MRTSRFSIGFVLTVSQWYRPEERSVRVAFVMASATLAGAFGGVIAYGAGHLNGRAGLEGFRWLFLIEGVVSVVSCLPVIFFLPDWPERSWLPAEDAKFATDRLEGMGYTKERSTKKDLYATCLSPRMLLHYVAYVSNFFLRMTSSDSIALDYQLYPSWVTYILHAYHRYRTRV